MVKGIRLFKCDNCKKIFIGLDIEYGATVFSQPVSCPKCNSSHTRPLFSSKSMYKRIWEEHDKNLQP